MNRVRAVVTISLLALMLAFRLAIAFQFSTSSPDGDQYLALTTSLLRDGRYAYGPPPAPLTYSRLPGYPLAAAAIDLTPRARDVHVRRNAIANAIFDTLTAALLALFIKEISIGISASWIGIAGMAMSPLAILWAVHALGESLATFLSVLLVYLLFRLARQGRSRVAVAAGVVAGLSQLVRFDSLVLLPAALLAIWFAPGDRRHKARLFGAYVATAALVFSPWPIRNLLRFGAPHPEGTEWLAQDGSPLPTGVITWMRTWCASAPNESHLADLIVFGHPFDSRSPGAILPQMYDSPEEHERLAALVDAIGKNRLDPIANRGFLALAHERTRSHPARTFLTLPIARVARLLLPPETRTIHWVKIPLLDWPKSFALFPIFYLLAYGFALMGAIALALRRAFLPLGLCAAAILMRLVLHSFAVPHQAGPRYFVESMPFVIALAALGIRRLGTVMRFGRIVDDG